VANQNYLELNTRQRAFVQEMRKKKPPERDFEYQCMCAELAGYKGRRFKGRGKQRVSHPLENVVKRLMGNPRVLAALEGFKMEELIGDEFGPDHITKKLIRIAQANMLDFAKWTEKGVEFIASDKLTREQGELIIKVSQKVSRYGTSLEIERLNPLDALDKLARIHAMYKDKLELTDPLDKDLKDLSDEEIRGGIAAILSQRPDLADALRRAIVAPSGPGAGAAAKA
jgi:hypothetical protein